MLADEISASLSGDFLLEDEGSGALVLQGTVSAAELTGTPDFTLGANSHIL